MTTQVYLIGGNGFLGRNLQAIWARAGLQHLEVIPVLRQSSSSSYPEPCIGLDSLKYRLSRPSTSRKCVVNCAALADVAACQQHPELSRRANFHLAINLAKISKEHNASFFQISSDGVFPGDQTSEPPMYWKAFQAKKGTSVYAQDKLDAERAIENLDFGTVIRLSFIGPSLGTNRGLISYLAKSFLNHIDPVGFTDNWFNPLHVEQVAEKLLSRVMTTPINGSFTLEQWGCFPAISKGHFLEKVIEGAGLNIPLELKKRGPGPFPLDQTMECIQPSRLTEVIQLSAKSLVSEIQSGQQSQ